MVKLNNDKLINLIKRTLSLRNAMIYGFLALMVTAALISGMTNAWFTASDNTENTFTAGILDLDATGPYDFDGTVYTQSSDVIFDPCASLSYLITNQGTKKAYVRAKFEGHWLRGYHENKASATVSYGGDQIFSDDSAHFNYPGGIQSEPLYDLDTGEGLFGFTDQLLIGPVQFEPLSSFNGASEFNYYNITGSPIFESFVSEQDEIPGLVTTPGEKFSFEAQNLANLADNLLNDLFGPSCLSPEGFKIDLGDAAFEVGTPQIFNDGDFAIKITKNDDKTFDFESTNPKYLVYHMFVKGGAQGTNLYTYFVDNSKVIPDGTLNYVSTAFVEAQYPNPNGNPFLPSITWISSQYKKDTKRVYIDLDKLSANGVNAGFELDAATGTGWSHITVYYCEVQVVPEPDLALVKLVQVEESGPWYTSLEYENTAIITALEELGYTIAFYDYLDDLTWPAATSYVPRFKIVVANTGNVILNQIQVSDDYFTGIDQVIGVLEPGQLWISEVVEYTGYLDPLSTDVITVKIDPLLQNDWIPFPDAQTLGEYFYYNKIIIADPSLEIPLHVLICLDDSALNNKYNGAIFKLFTYFEAVQTTNGLVDDNWPDHPY